MAYTYNPCLYDQMQDNSYAYWASRAYINTVLQIPGVITPPSFLECMIIASYNGYHGGDPLLSLKLLESHFKYGILFKKQKDLSIRETLKNSSILSFTTSQESWRNFAGGQLLTKPINVESDQYWYYAIVEGYDFEKDCYVCKKLLRYQTDNPRFLFSKSEANHFYFIKVYLGEKMTNSLMPKLEKFKGKLYGRDIDCAWMDKKTAIYCEDYVCEYHPNRKSDLNFLGYEIDQWISLNLQYQKNNDINIDKNKNRNIDSGTLKLSELNNDSNSDSKSQQLQISPIKTLNTEFITELLINKKILGRGATSIVYKVVNLFTHKGFLALKVLNEILKVTKAQNSTIWNDEEESDDDLNEETFEIDFEKARQIFTEYEILNNLNHPNIIKVFGFYFGDKQHEPAILLEYCKFNLEKAIGLLENVDLVGIIYEICSAMMHIHANKIIHRDLKPQNILIDKYKHVKICDFGIAKVLDATTLTSITHNKGTFLYMAPEMFKMDQLYSQKVDVYSFGVVLFFILTKGKLPSPNGVYGLENCSLPTNINNLSKKIIHKCWSTDPNKRPSFKNLLHFIVDKNFMLIDGIEKNVSNLKQHLGLV